MYVASDTEDTASADDSSNTEESLLAESVEALNPLSGYFQLWCMDSYMQAGCLLLVISLMTCLVVAGFLGITSVVGATASAALSTVSACVGGLSLVASFGVFSTRTNEDAEHPERRPDYSLAAT